MNTKKNNYSKNQVKYAYKYKNKFILAFGNQLYCNLCNCKVTSDRKSTIDKHSSSTRWMFFSFVTSMEHPDLASSSNEFLKHSCQPIFHCRN